MVKSNNSFKREWKICNFSKLGEDWLSEVFTVGDYKWYFLPFLGAYHHSFEFIYFSILMLISCVGSSGCIQKVVLTIRGIINIWIFLKSVDAKDFDHLKKVMANCSISLKDQKNGGCKKLSCKTNIYLFLFVSVAIFRMELLQDEYHYKPIVSFIFQRINFFFCLSIGFYFPLFDFAFQQIVFGFQLPGRIGVFHNLCL